MKISLKCTTPKIRVKENAQLVAGNLDTPWLQDLPYINYKHHLLDCLECPTRGLIARHQIIDSTKDVMNHSRYKKNKKRIQNHPTFREMQSKLDSMINTLYPTTKKIRNYIIKNNRINFDTLTQNKKFTYLDKIKIFFS